jgi:hypothetical protein
VPGGAAAAPQYLGRRRRRLPASGFLAEQTRFRLDGRFRPDGTFRQNKPDRLPVTNEDACTPPIKSAAADCSAPGRTPPR